MNKTEQIGKLILEVVAERFDKEPLETEGLEFGDSFAELLDKFIILHIRCWKLEDYIATEANTDRRIADAKRKLDYCFKDRRPKLTKAINSFLDVYISKNHARPFSVENTKVYEGFEN